MIDEPPIFVGGNRFIYRDASDHLSFKGWSNELEEFVGQTVFVVNRNYWVSLFIVKSYRESSYSGVRSPSALTKSITFIIRAIDSALIVCIFVL